MLLAPLLQLKGLRFGDFDSARLASVVPSALFDLRMFCRKYVNCEPAVIGDPDVELGIRVQTDRPEAVGADRLVNTVSAHHTYKGALIVVDFGTATTFDIVSENGDYVGGVIAPGANLSAEALHQGAAMLPRVAIARTQSVIGKDTVPAMQSGLYWGYIGLIEGLVARIKEEYGKPMTVIGTGGLANLFHRQTPVIDHLDPDLTIRGLIMIHARNAARAKAKPRA
jgi:type III pantothenate kinase